MITDFQSKLESLLLILAGPTSFKKLASLLSVDKDEIKQIANQLDEQYKTDNRGWRLTQTENEVQLVSNPVHAKFIEKVIKAELREELTPAALETLAIVAYQGIVRKAEIDFIRGVNSTYALRSLLIRGLIERKTYEKDGRSFTYAITSDFLNYLGLNKVTELPEHQEIIRKLDETKKEFAQTGKQQVPTI